MSAAPLYTITSPVSHGGKANVYRATRGSDRRAVILKVLDPRHSRPKDVEELRREYEIGSSLDTPAVVRPLALETYRGLPALVMEDFGGQPLDGLLGAPMAIEPFLALAVQLAGAVADVHQRRVVHRDLKPHNVIVNLATGEVKITDFGLASRLSRDSPPEAAPHIIEGSLPYLSPEQTGRTNRPIDGRADLYSLGMTLYEMLTGRLPFEAKDPVEWVHCHIARMPPSPAEIVREVPETLARIVLKLLAKAPEDRYQTARGLRFDLERCLASLRRSGKIAPFAPGEQDSASRLRIPQRLFGREAETTEIVASLGRVVATGTPELVLVSGDAGIGKSALVHELDGPIARAGASFLSGKFDQFKRDIPYATIFTALRGRVREILAESEPRVVAWRERLVAALGAGGRLVVDVIPEMELVIGRLPPVPELPPAEAQHRFRGLFRRLIGVLAQEEHPLALFLDDLQWADAASLALIEDLLSHVEVRHLLLVGAYRDDEVSPGHPLVSMMDEVRRAGARVSHIALGPIAREPFIALVAEALHGCPEDTAPLAELVHERTAGNPFFAIQFLVSLEEERLIELDERTGRLTWDVARIRAKGSTDNVVDLMIGKLRRLSPATQEALKELACLGNPTEVSLWTMAHGGSEEDAHADLQEAVSAGLVLHAGRVYRFLHDRVHEAAYSLLPDGSRAAAHLAIGRRLAARMAPAEIEENVFEVVSQLDRGAALITSRAELERVAELDLLAAERAKGSAAHASARKYSAAGAALLGEEGWASRYELAFALELRRAECEYLTGELGAAEERLSALSRRARDLVDLGAVTCARVALYTTMDRSDRAIEAGLDYLRRVGVDWSSSPSDEEVRREYQRTRRLLGGRTIESLVDLPSMTDPVARATLDVLTACQAPALFTDQALTCLVIGRMVNLSLEHGNSDASPFAYVAIAMVLGARFGEHRDGYRFGALALRLVDERAFTRFRARVYEILGYLVIPWTRHVREGIGLVRRAFAAAQEAGDLTYASYARHSLVSALLAEGAPLGEVEREAEQALAFVRGAKFGLAVDRIAGQLQLVRALRGVSPDPSSPGARIDEGELERRLAGDPRLSIASCFYWIRKLEARCFLGDHAAALDAASRAEPLLWTSMSFFEVAEYHFYAAMARAARCDAAPDEERRRHLAAISAHHRALAAWAESSPEGFTSRAALVAAELSRLGGRAEEAEGLYERAIGAARAGGFVHEEAIAYETAARFYRARGFDLFADAYLREARIRYLRWGADGKVRQLDRAFPQIVEREPLAPAATLAMATEELDLHAVIRASQTISGEMVLDTLIRTLLEVVLEQGGAERACLVLRRDGDLSVEAEAAFDGRGAATVVFGPFPVGTSERVPASVVHYVERTKERVIVPDVASDARRMAGDAYFARARPRSVLCVPVLRQAEVVGLLYLENNLLAGAFTPDRLAALSLLATQAAISLENALLLAKERAARAEAEEAVRARSEFLTVASHELNTPMTSLLLAVQSLRRSVAPEGPLDARVLEGRLDLVSRQAARLSRLTNDLLDVSRIDSGLLALELTDVDAGALVREVVSRFQADLSAARCPVSIHEGAKGAGRWDRSRIDRVVTNLLANAIKFGAGKPIEVSVGAEGGVARIAVHDHGIGVDPDQRDRIFGRFERAVSERHYGGLGLGLYISRRIVESHGGSIRCESQPGAGSTFVVELPCAGPGG